VQIFLPDEDHRIRCPGCNRVIDVSALRPGERFKCAKCRKFLSLGPHLRDPAYAANWRTVRVVLLVGCMAATVWCVTLGYDFGLRTGSWTLGFGGAVAVWLLAAGCIGLAARTTQNNGVMVGVTALMAGLALFFLERLGSHVGYDVAAWRRFRFFAWWAPGLMVIGLGVVAAALAIQARLRSL